MYDVVLVFPFRRYYYPLLEKAGLPRITFHDLRHSIATILLGEDAHSKEVADLLGHSRIKRALDTYTHVLPHMQAT